MKQVCKWMVALLFFVATGAPAWAMEAKRVVVLPFVVHSAESIDYLKQGIGDMLVSRLSVNEKIEVVNRDTVLAAMKDTSGKALSLADVSALGKRLNADFVITGAVTKIGNSLSVDGQLIDVGALKSALSIVAQCQSMDEVIPKVTDLSQKMEAHILGVTSSTRGTAPSIKEVVVSRPSAPQPAPQSQPAPQAQPAPQPTREAEIISGMKGGRKGTFTSSINPDFINAAQPIDSKSFWKSQQFPYALRGVDVGDVNGDGLNETVMIDENNVYIYQKKEGEFKLIQHIPGKRYDNYLSLDIADINGNGIKEIIVSSYSGNMVNSFVMEFRNGKYETIAQGLRWFMRVITNSSGIPILLGQHRGVERPFLTPIHEIVWQGGEYREGKKMRIPEGLSVFGLTLDKLTPGGDEMVIALNEDDFLYVIEATDKPLSRLMIFGGSAELRWKSDDVFGGSNTFIEPIMHAAVDGREALGSRTRYVHPRIITYDTNKDGKREIIILKNISAAGRVFDRVKLFNAAEIHNLEWDNMGMVENWRTKKITGYVSDYQFKDIDNDGENEIVLALVLSGGGLTKGRSIIVTYSLKGQ